MKLLKLSSNNPNFKTLEFNDGLNIVAGIQLTKEQKETYNGIGKSFSLNMIHLMFGASLDKRKEKERKILDFLSDYGFFELEFEHRNKPYKIKKNFSEPHFFLNEKKITKTDFPGELRNIFISKDFDSSISFKQLLNVFARRFDGNYYSDTTTQQGMLPTDYHQAYVNLALLKLDTALVSSKKKVKEQLNSLKKAKKAVADYEKLLEESNVKDLIDERDQLLVEKENFIIAKNYDNYKKEADELTNELNEIRNKIYSIEKSLTRKFESLELSKNIDIDVNRVKRIYEEAKFFFQDEVSARLKDAKDFHIRLMENRLGRIEAEIDVLNEQKLAYLNVLEKKEVKRDSILKDLDSKGALSEYNSINERVRTLDSEIKDLERYKKVLSELEEKSTKLEVQNAKIKAKSIEYVSQKKPQLDDIEDKFRSLVKRFYTNHGGHLRISPSVDAQYLFDIDVHIPRDGSQGVKEVKIFCYDFLLYQLNPELLGFVAHDGCIFSEMDPRQKSMIFKVAIDFVKNNGLQYFINIGQASLDEVLDKDGNIGILTEEECLYIAENIILKLYDLKPENWLFGKAFG